MPDTNTTPHCTTPHCHSAFCDSPRHEVREILIPSTGGIAGPIHLRTFRCRYHADFVYGEAGRNAYAASGR